MESKTLLNGRIIKGVGGLYTVRVFGAGKEEITCRAKGLFRHENITPMVGDFVTVLCADEEKNNKQKL